MKTRASSLCNAIALVLTLWAASVQAVPVFSDDPANAITNTITFPPGWSLIANPFNHNRGTTVLDAVLDNTVGELFKAAPQGTLLFKFDNSTQSFSENRFRGRRWSKPAETLAPGEGAWLFNPTRSPLTVTFTGNCQYAGSVEVPTGWSLISSPECGTINFAHLVWPPPAGCGVIPCAPFPPFGWDSLSFNPQEDDVVYTFDRSTQRFQTHTFHNGTWDAIPVVGLAESCLVHTTHPRVIRYLGFPPL